MSGRKASINIIPGLTALSVGMPDRVPPKGWKWYPLNEVATMATGHTPSRKYPEYWGGEIPWISVADARPNHGKTIQTTKEYTNELGIKKSAAVLLPAGTVCLSRTGSIGYSIILGKEMATSQGFVNWLCGEKLLPRFLQLLFITENSFLHSISEGVAHTTIYFPEAKAFHVCIPSIDEQKEIVSKIEELISELDKGIEELKTTQQQLKVYRQAVLKWAFEGKLTNEDVKEGELPEGWKWKPLGKVCNKIQDGSHFSPKNQYTEPAEDRFMYITAKNIRNDYMDLSKLTYVDKDFHDSIYQRCNPEYGDVLLTKDGVNTGEVTLNTIHEPFSLLSSVCIFKTHKEQLTSAFLKYFIQSPFGSKAITNSMTGTAIKRIILRKIKESPVVLTSIEEQNQIVQEIESRLSVCDKIEDTIANSLNEAEALRQSILKQAFKGELK